MSQKTQRYLLLKLLRPEHSLTRVHVSFKLLLFALTKHKTLMTLLSFSLNDSAWLIWCRFVLRDKIFLYKPNPKILNLNLHKYNLKKYFFFFSKKSYWWCNQKKDNIMLFTPKHFIGTFHRDHCCLMNWFLINKYDVYWLQNYLWLIKQLS